jgi:hypothetical protein
LGATSKISRSAPPVTAVVVASLPQSCLLSCPTRGNGGVNPREVCGCGKYPCQCTLSRPRSQRHNDYNILLLPCVSIVNGRGQMKTARHDAWRLEGVELPRLILFRDRKDVGGTFSVTICYRRGSAVHGRQFHPACKRKVRRTAESEQCRYPYGSPVPGAAPSSSQRQLTGVEYGSHAVFDLPDGRMRVR